MDIADFSLMVTYRFFPLRGLIPDMFSAGLRRWEANAERDCEVYLCPQ